jgi:FKBP-type peptidyl-prolyl cis-trans isomerase
MHQLATVSLPYKQSKMSSTGQRRIRRKSNDSNDDRPERENGPKRLKTNNNNHSPSKSNSETVEDSVVHAQTGTLDKTNTSLPPPDGVDNIAPKSRKELRKEKKALKVKTITGTSSNDNKTEIREKTTKSKSAALQVQLTADDKMHLKRQNQQELRKEFKAAGVKAKEERDEAHARARKEAHNHGHEKKVKLPPKSSKKSKESSNSSNIVEMDVYNNLFKGTVDSTGTTTCALLGVKYKDVVVGKGKLVQDRTVIVVKYQLTGGKFGAVLDSNNKFSFVLGKGQVIRGWDIGILGMHQGGIRHLIVPPKAGYGSKDIGAGQGGILHFDITLLSC